MSFDYRREVASVRERFRILAPQTARTILENELNCSGESKLFLIEKAIQTLPISGHLRGKRNNRLVWAIGHILKTLPDTEKRKNDFEKQYSRLFDRAFPRIRRTGK